MTVYQRLKNTLGAQEQSVRNFVRRVEDLQEKLMNALRNELGVDIAQADLVTVDASGEKQAQEGEYGVLTREGYHFRVEIRFDGPAFDLDCTIVPQGAGLAGRIGDSLVPLNDDYGPTRWARKLIDYLETQIKTLGVVAQLAETIEEENSPSVRRRQREDILS